MKVFTQILYACMIIATVTVSGCSTPDIQRIAPDSMLLPVEHKLLLFKVSRDLFNYRIDAPPEGVYLPGIETVPPSRTGLTGTDLEDLVITLIRETPVDMAIGIHATPRVHQQYNSYQVFKGWKRLTIRDGSVRGRPVYRETSRPVYETRYQNSCTVITYDIYQFDRSGNWIGASGIANPVPPECPQSADTDVVLDEIDYVATWLTTHLKIR